MSFSSDWIGEAAATENSFTRIAELRQGLDFLFAAEGAASKLDLINPVWTLWERFDASRVPGASYRLGLRAKDCFP
jgi:hypothetical protein